MNSVLLASTTSWNCFRSPTRTACVKLRYGRKDLSSSGCPKTSRLGMSPSSIFTIMDSFVAYPTMVWQPPCQYKSCVRILYMAVLTNKQHFCFTNRFSLKPNNWRLNSNVSTNWWRIILKGTLYDANQPQITPFSKTHRPKQMSCEEEKMPTNVMHNV